MGCRRGTPVDELEGLLDTTLAAAGLDRRHVVELVTADTKAEEPGLVSLAARLGVPLRTYPAAALATHAVPRPSELVRDAVGAPSVSEAAVLASGADLVVPKQTGRAATCALGRRPRGGSGACGDG